jgi:hypothetical protein
VLPGGRQRLLSGVESLDVAHAEDVTPALLGWWCTEREATEAVRNGGDWREPVAEDANEPLDLADRLTGEGGA